MEHCVKHTQFLDPEGTLKENDSVSLKVSQNKCQIIAYRLCSLTIM